MHEEMGWLLYECTEVSYNLTRNQRTMRMVDSEKVPLLSAFRHNEVALVTVTIVNPCVKRCYEIQRSRVCNVR